MKRWFGLNKLSKKDFESHQSKLLRLSKDVLRKYENDLETDLADPARIAAIYGSGFMEGSFKKQAENAALTAATILMVPNSDVNIVLPDRQEAIASIRDNQVADPMILSINDSYCKNVISTGRELAVELSENHPLVCDSSMTLNGEIVSYLGVPIAEPGGVIVGVLCVWSSEERIWTVSDVQVLTELSFTLTRSLRTQNGVV